MIHIRIRGLGCIQIVFFQPLGFVQYVHLVTLSPYAAMQTGMHVPGPFTSSRSGLGQGMVSYLNTLGAMFRQRAHLAHGLVMHSMCSLNEARRIGNIQTCEDRQVAYRVQWPIVSSPLPELCFHPPRGFKDETLSMV